MSGEHPYRDLPASAYWRRAVATSGPAIDPVVFPFPTISRSDRVATAGSCFAQHIARHLAASGFHFLVTEPAHPILPADVAAEHGYGVFTARYGNIYTSAQLLQTFDRAYGRFVPREDVWDMPGGGIADPYRPSIEPGGFASVAELHADRAYHLAKVREAFETLDVFVFTLGLTEHWFSRQDGAVFPICPGVIAGRFDPQLHAFGNLRVADVTRQVAAFIERLRTVNPKARVILTVSPVPLAATALPDRHVLSSTIYSKAVLRAAAQELTEDIPNVAYFPSYEIITGPQARGRFFSEDLRSVTDEGVAHVMSTFVRHAAAGDAAEREALPQDEGFHTQMQAFVQAMCDESALDPEPR